MLSTGSSGWPCKYVRACVYSVLYKTTARGVLSVELIMTTTIRTLYESRAKSY